MRQTDESFPFSEVGLHRSGLPCRFSAYCGVRFQPVRDTVEEIGNAALLRNDHELKAHGYLHRAIETKSRQWTRPVVGIKR